MESLATVRANRLIGLRNHPGWNELIRIGEGLVQQAQEISTDFGGYDPMQIVMLKARAQTAKEYHSLMLATVARCIQEGIAEAMELKAHADVTAPHNAIEDADDLRKAVLSYGDADGRIPGSY